MRMPPNTRRRSSSDFGTRSRASTTSATNGTPDEGSGPSASPTRTRKELLFDGTLYDVTEWIHRHPGGKVIEFYTKSGEDATLAVQQFHQRSAARVRGIMHSLPKRPAGESDEIMSVLSPETLARHRTLTADFVALHFELEREGFFEPSIAHLVGRLVELVTLAVVGYICLATSYKSHYGTRAFGVLTLALFGGRCGWLMHEGGHHSLTGNPKWDRALQAVIHGFGDGMSGSWWSYQHNRHHAMPQRLQHDVDLRTLPLVAFNSEVVPKMPGVDGSPSGSSFWIRHQAWLFLAIDTVIVAWLWKLVLHPLHILRHRARPRAGDRPHPFLIELPFITLHYYFAYQFGLVNYLLIVWLASVYMFGQFTLSHTHLPVTSEPLHWVEYALLHTVDVEPSWWCDWWMGYLNYQIEHHLFPTMPEFRHRLIVPRVRALAARHGLPYQCPCYMEAVAKTFRNLKSVADEVG